MAEAKRKFYLRDADGNPVPGIVGLASREHNLIVKDDGVIDIDKLTAQQMDELERMAVTDGHPISEGEPKGIK